MNWTTKYPTQPGYYWLRRAELNRWPDSIPNPIVVQLDNDLQFYTFDHTLPYFAYFCSDLVSAEWCGPILPPQPDTLVPVMPHRWHIEPHNKCWCLEPQENEK